MKGEEPIDHAEEAVRLLGIDDRGLRWQGDVVRAQVHATLALVEQLKRVADAIVGKYGPGVKP